MARSRSQGFKKIKTVYEATLRTSEPWKRLKETVEEPFYKKYSDYLGGIQKSDILIGFISYEWDSLGKVTQTPGCLGMKIQYQMTALPCCFQILKEREGCSIGPRAQYGKLTLWDFGLPPCPQLSETFRNAHFCRKFKFLYT